MKTKEELNAIKKEVEELNEKLRELTEEELAQVAGGSDGRGVPYNIPDDEVGSLGAEEGSGKGVNTPLY